MRRGERGPHSRRHSARGIAYLGVLLLTGALALGATQAARIWKTVQLRDREAQLLFVGDQIRQAIAHYYNSAEGSRFPPSLDALVEDRRGPQPLRHLRRVYPDPLTHSREWGLIEAPEGGVMGVYSKAEGRPLKQQGFPDDYAGFDGKDAYADWAFVYLPSPIAASPQASTTSSASPGSP